MNTLDDLRAALDERSGDIDATRLDHVHRRQQVQGRIAVRRRRRTQVRAGGLAVAVVALAAAVALPRLDTSEVSAADREVLGQLAPEAISADGWTYRFAAAEQSRGERVSIDLAQSPRPRLLTWATADDMQDVRIAGAGMDWVSASADFADHLVVPQGFEGKVRASTTAGSGVAIAVYEVDLDHGPAGVGDPAGIFFRDSTPSARQVGAAVGEPGQTELLVDWQGAAGSLSMETACEGVPKGMVVNVSLTGADDADSSGPCDGGFDPGATPSTAFELGDLGDRGDRGDRSDRSDMADVEPEDAGTARVWLSRSTDDSRAVDPSEAPDVRLGLGLYTPVGGQHDVLGFEFADTIGAFGHQWKYAATLPAGIDTTVDVREFTAQGPAVMSVVQRIRRGSGVSFRIATQGAPELARTSFGTYVSGTSAMGQELLLPGTTSVTIELDGGDADTVLEQWLVVHRLAD